MIDSKMAIFPKVLNENISYKELANNLFARKNSSLSRALKELIAVVISKTSNCSYCFKYHFAEMQRYGIDYDLAAQIMIDYKSSSLESHIILLLEFCENLIYNDNFEISNLVLDNLLKNQWSYREIFDAVALSQNISLMNQAAMEMNFESSDLEISFSRTPIQKR
jgi:AhpD family alkylhydroperoxidase